MIKVEISELYDNDARTTREAAMMLLLLRRTLTDCMTFCAFDNIRVPTTTRQSPRVQLLLRGNLLAN
jgi:hypothetical protein